MILSNTWVIFVESGRLGNQIFQYAGLTNYFNPKKILLIGFNDLNLVFRNLDCKIIYLPNNKFRNNLKKIIYETLLLLAKFRLIKLYNFNYTENSEWALEKSNGLLPLAIVKTVYFQDYTLAQKGNIEKIKFRDELILKANQIINKYNLKNAFFCHIRRGDYINWPTATESAILPDSWYIDAIVKVRDKYPNSKIIFFTDDKPYVSANYAVKNSVIFNHDPYVDFVLMSQLNGGILSPSSYSWWASFFIFKSNNNAYLCAPKYWGGHKLSKWHPNTIKTSWIKYFDVKK